MSSVAVPEKGIGCPVAGAVKVAANRETLGGGWDGADLLGVLALVQFQMASSKAKETFLGLSSSPYSLPSSRSVGL